MGSSTYFREGKEMKMLLFLLMLVSLHWIDVKISQRTLPLKIDKSALKKPLHSLKLKRMTRGNTDFWIKQQKQVKF